MPSVDLVGQAARDYDTSGVDGENTVFAAELQLSIPIYQQGAEYSVIRQAKETANQSRLLVDNTRREVVDAAARASEAYQTPLRSDAHTSDLQSLMPTSYAVLC